MMTRCALVAALATVAVSVPAQVPDLYDMNTVRDVYLRFAITNYWSQMTTYYAPETNIAATMTVDNVTYPNVGVRFRGNTSYTQLPASPTQGWEKKCFNIEMDWMVAGQDIHGYDHLNFNNGFHDPLFLREPLTYYVMRRHGVAPKCNWVRLHLAGPTGGFTPWGIYINVQQPNKDMMKEWFRSNDGNRYRCFPVSGGFSNGRCCYTVLNPHTVANYLTAYQAKQGDGLDLMNMITVLNATTPSTPQTTLTSVFNVDSFYRYAAVMNVCTNTDSYLSSGKDHYLYIDEVHGDGTTFPFDLNEAMRGSTTLSPTMYTTTTTRPGFTKTLQFPDWTERYKAHIRHIVDTTFNDAHLVPLVNQWHALIYNDVIADTKKIYTTAQFQQNLTTQLSVTQAGGGTIPGLLPFITARYNFLNTNAYLTAARATLSNLAHSPTNPNPTQPIQFTVQASANATAVNLYWRRIGAFQKLTMFDDGAHGDGAANDGVWGIAIAAQQPGSLVDYYVEAKTATTAASYLPYTAELERNCPHVQIDWNVAPSPIVINEFVAQNVTGPVDEANQHEDWLELYNNSNQAVDVSGMWLSDSLVVLKFPLPAGTIIAPFGVLRIWCDEDGTQGPLHANFKLSSDGEVVALYAANGLALHDSFTFGPQLADVSTGRIVDAALPWVTFPSPTYLATNLPASCGQRTYGAQDPTQHGVSLTLSGTAQIGTSPTYGITGGPANGLGLFAISLLADHVALSPYGVPDETLLLSPLALAIPAALPLDGSGASSWVFNIPNDAGFVGVRLYAQTLTIGGTGYDTSRAIETRICP